MSQTTQSSDINIPIKHLADPEVLASFGINTRSLLSVIPGESERFHVLRYGELRLMDKSGQTVRSIAVPTTRYMIKIPGGFAFSDWENKKVMKFSENCEDKLMMLFSSGKYSPLGLAYTSSGHFLVCLYHWNKGLGRVVKCTTNGSVELQIEKSRGKHLFTWPFDITETLQKNIFVIDNLEKVTVFNSNGVFQRTYVGLNCDPDFSPQRLCADSNGYVIISDTNNDMIHIVDNEGQFVRYMNYDGISRPYSLSVFQDDTILVCEFNDRRDVKLVRYRKTERSNSIITLM